MGKISKRSLTNRIVVGIAVGVFMAGLVVATAFDHIYPAIRLAVSVILSVLLWLAVIEMRRALGEERIPKDYSWIIWTYSIGFGLIYIFFGFTGIVLFTLLIFACSAITAMKKNNFESLLYIAFTLVYPGLLMACFLFINKSASTQIITSDMEVYDYVIHDIWSMISVHRDTQLLPYNTIGLAFVFAVSALTDVCAFIFGVSFGKHKLMPTVSPKKTVEGAVGGVFGGLLGAGLVYMIFEYWQIFGAERGLGIHTLSNTNLILAYVAIGIFGSVLTQLGDLLASFVKRYCGIKDYSRLLGEHGGIMDRMDGMMLNAAFVAFVYMFII